MSNSLLTEAVSLQTKRLVIRRLRASDVADAFVWCSDPVVSRYLSWEPHQSLEDTKQYIADCEQQYHAGAIAPWAIEYQQIGRVVGTCNFVHYDPEFSRADIGYCLSPTYWGQGIAAEAAQVVLAYGFAHHLERIQATCHPDNSQSVKVLKRLGFQYEGLLRSYARKKSALIDVEMYSLLKTDHT